MSAALLALMMAAGSSVWVYTKLQDRTGYGNNKNAAIGAAAVFALLFIIILTLAKMLLHN
jgi:hypothetical protein